MNLLHFKLKLPILNVIILAGLFAFGARKADTVLVNPTVVINTDPAQYGTPFTGVPDSRDAVIYQVNMRAFSSSRNFQGVIARLDSIRNLGVNVIYLLPTYPIGTLKAVNSLFCVKDYRTVNPEFGTLTDLRALIDGAHSRGMAVMFDWVANHSSWDNAWINSHKDWYKQDASGNIVSPILGWTDVAQLNFDNHDMRLAMISAMKSWVFTANCDGFRCDYADGPPADFWKQTIDTLRNITTHKLLLLAEGARSDHFTSGFNYTFGFRFYDQLKAIYSSNTSVAGINSIVTNEYAGAAESNRVVHYLTNHDVNSTDGTPLDLFGGKTGSMAAFVAAAYMKGVPMIYDGQEVGYPQRLSMMGTNTLIDWSLNPAMVADYKRIIAFYNSSNALRKGVLTLNNTADVCAFKKVYENDTVFVVANLRNVSKSFTLPAGIANKQKYDAFTNEAINLGSGISLSAYEYKVFADRGAVIPVTGLTLSPETETIAANSTKQLFATLAPVNATYKSISWSSTDATVAFVSSNGLVTGISPGTAFIIGKNANHADTCELTVTGTAVSGIVFNTEKDSVEVGNTIKLGYTILPNDATNKTVNWSSGNTAIATVNSTGLVKGVAEGSAFIYAETADGKKRDTCEILVQPGNAFTVYFSKPTTWASTIKIYYWNPLPSGILPAVNWPGVDMTLSNGWYKYTFANVSFTNLIFNDKTKQTGNLARDKDGWYKNDIWYDTNPDPVAISEENLINFSIYPNPVDDSHFTIFLKSGDNKANMKIIDLQGRNVFESKLTAEQTNYNLPLLKHGVYIVSVNSASYTHYQKIVVK